MNRGRLLEAGQDFTEMSGRWNSNKNRFSAGERLHEPAGDDEPSRGSPALLIGRSIILRHVYMPYVKHRAESDGSRLISEHQ